MRQGGWLGIQNSKFKIKNWLRTLDGARADTSGYQMPDADFSVRPGRVRSVHRPLRPGAGRRIGSYPLTCIGSSTTLKGMAAILKGER